MSVTDVEAGGTNAAGNKSPRDIVLEFFEAFSRDGTKSAFSRYLHNDVIKCDTGLGCTIGLDMALLGLQSYLEIFHRPYVSIDIKNIATNGNVVFAERVETNENRETGDKFVGELTSVMVIEGDKIIRWSDYYDPSDYKYGRAMPRTPAVTELMKKFGELRKKGISIRTKLWDFADKRFLGN